MFAGTRSVLLRPWVKPVLLALCLLPAAWLVVAAATDQLGANPAQALVRATGDWTLRSLCLVLAITPLRLITRTPALARFRRMLGLLVFFYAVLHLLAYAWLDMGLDPQDIVRDVFKRPFITVGMMAFAILLALAVTSWQSAIRWLGGARWQALHRSVYAASLLALLHFFWMRSSKNDLAEVAVYGVVIGSLLLWRLRRALVARYAARLTPIHTHR